MKHEIEESLRVLCHKILNENKSIEEWSEIESSDMFQEGNYNGGFDSIEEEFCFSVYIDDVEYWFQFPLEDVPKIISREISVIDVRKADV